jgi:Domain of unknown function (DUF4331)
MDTSPTRRKAPTALRRTRSRKKSAAFVVAGAVLATAGATALGPVAAQASSHREAPLIAGAPQYDNTDVYAFVSPDKPDTTTLIANWIPFENPSGGPNFYQFATDGLYDINIDNNGDAKPDITYRWVFSTTYQNNQTFLYNTGPVTSLTDPDLNIRQTYKLYKIAGGKTTLLTTGKVAPSDVGKASMPSYGALRSEAITNAKDGTAKITSFAGQADDPFFLDLRVFDLLYGGNLSEVGHDSLKGYNVNTIALQVPSAAITAGGDPVVGVWSDTYRKSAGGKYVQISRLGNPLVNEVVIPLKDKDKFNGSKPADDGQFLSYVTDPGLPKVVQAVYGIKAPATPRNDLVSVFLTGVKGLNQPAHLTAPGEELRLNTAIMPTKKPNRLGVIGGDTQGFPNGRRLTDDVIDIALQVVEGELVGSPNDLGDGVNANDSKFGTHFPYVALPHTGSVGGTPKASSAGLTALNGGGGGTDGSSSTPIGSVLALGVGLLTMIGGTVAYRRSRRQPASPDTAVSPA